MTNFLVKDGDKASWGIPEGYPRIGIITLVDRTVIPVSTGSHFLNLPFTIKLVSGESYTVEWDGNVYEQVAFHMGNSIVIGNTSLSEIGDDTGEPFCIVYEKDKCILIADFSTEHTMCIMGLGIQKMDANLIPYMPLFINVEFKTIIGLGSGYYADTNVATMTKAFNEGRSVFATFTDNGGIKFYVHMTGFTPYKNIQCPVFGGIQYNILNKELSYDTFMAADILNNGEYFTTQFVWMDSLSSAPASTSTLGLVKQAAAVANVTAAPTSAEFNALLNSLRDAGILATS